MCPGMHLWRLSFRGPDFSAVTPFLLSYQKIELESVSIYLNILKGPQVYKFLEQFSGTLSKIMLV